MSAPTTPRPSHKRPSRSPKPTTEAPSQDVVEVGNPFSRYQVREDFTIERRIAAWTRGHAQMQLDFHWPDNDRREEAELILYDASQMLLAIEHLCALACKLQSRPFPRKLRVSLNILYACCLEVIGALKDARGLQVKTKKERYQRDGIMPSKGSRKDYSKPGAVLQTDFHAMMKNLQVARNTQYSSAFSGLLAWESHIALRVAMALIGSGLESSGMRLSEKGRIAYIRAVTTTRQCLKDLHHAEPIALVNPADKQDLLQP